MAEMACPQCGNPNLDVDAENSVVYCKNCGFAVKVDPATGNVTPLNEGGPQTSTGGKQQLQPPAAYRDRAVLGMDPMTFFLLASIINLGLTFMKFYDVVIAGIVEVVIVYLYFKG